MAEHRIRDTFNKRFLKLKVLSGIGANAFLECYTILLS